MNQFAETNQALMEAEKQVALKTHELTDATERYLLAEANYENAFSQFLLETKLKHPDATQSETKAVAITLSFDHRIEFVRAESNYRKLQNEIKALNSKLEVYKEISFNLRREATIR